jgi:hypothetical protein
MWAATGRRYGRCETTVVVCNPGRPDPLYQTYPVGGYGDGPGLGPYIAVGGGWRNGGCGGGCTCTAECEVVLDGPVDSIVEVHVGGELVDPDAYEVHDRHLLVRIDGGCWPTCGSMIPTYGMTVTYLRGTIPDHIQAASETLACQYAKACTGGACVLPQRLASLSRQGVDFQVAEVAADGSDWWATGIDTVDRVIAADNPGHLRGPAEVLTPDLPRHRTVLVQSSATVAATTVSASGGS